MMNDEPWHGMWKRVGWAPLIDRVRNAVREAVRTVKPIAIYGPVGMTQPDFSKFIRGKKDDDEPPHA